jgi:hypothetical protein
MVTVAAPSFAEGDGPVDLVDLFLALLDGVIQGSKSAGELKQHPVALQAPASGRRDRHLGV